MGFSFPLVIAIAQPYRLAGLDGTLALRLAPPPTTTRLQVPDSRLSRWVAGVGRFYSVHEYKVENGLDSVSSPQRGRDYFQSDRPSNPDARWSRSDHQARSAKRIGGAGHRVATAPRLAGMAH